jgi:hypothetical protein
MDNARHAFADALKDDPHASFKYLLLKFPSDHDLSGQAIHSKAGEDEQLTLKALGCKSRHQGLREVFDES